jgi:hypothetical protein
MQSKKLYSAVTNHFKEKPTMKRIVFICSALVLLNAAAFGQKTKPWTEWNVKDAQKVLADSAWAQSQTEYTETAPTGGTITPVQPRNAATTTAAQNTESGETLGRKGPPCRRSIMSHFSPPSRFGQHSST